MTCKPKLDWTQMGTRHPRKHLSQGPHLEETKTSPEGRKTKAADKVEKLRKRMLEEKLRVVDYLERKKEDETIMEIGKFWEEQSRELFLENGKKKVERLSINRGIRAIQLQKDYQDRWKLDTNLTGWTS
jgi:hypothetical protein